MPTRPASSIQQQGPRRTLHWGDQPRRQTAPPATSFSAKRPQAPVTLQGQTASPQANLALRATIVPTTPHRLYQGNATSHDTSSVTPTRHPHPMRTFPPEIRTT
ncbi:hypothetical protein THAOC_32319 [Thalassiosira oceanica]|uniref:Uncharacterized protein n=1 Tax=Thalassiosira oceanica TaxID=159749 RepID=K0RIV4_THAOC|nr:hypothetical protein THAOC_32319 [Thalassiosira oceanica]|eukprot:EJK48851.1 hypothetical protein THAOC_32319 [Thalassiosira oceanica]